MANEMNSNLHGAPTVLIVDDEDTMREVCEIMVADAGGTSLSAADGGEAVAVFAKNADSIGCVVMDFSMPVMDGYQAAAEIRKLRPHTAIVMISGLKPTPELQTLCQDPHVEFLAKPFRREKLIGAINRVREAAAKLSAK
jgi:CheY-like chemotaxis protein